MSERICVLAWQKPGVTGVSRGTKLHVAVGSGRPLR
jgi:hypothetical protein